MKTMIKKIDPVWSAIFAALLALAISLPFSAAYYLAYPGYQTPPFWWADFRAAFPGLFSFAAYTRSYQVYGRMYSLVIPLTLPALLSLKNHMLASANIPTWKWRVFYAGVIMFGLGVVGDYWFDQDSFWIAIGFFLELSGTLVLGVGAILYGLAALKGDGVPRWVGFGLVGIAPGGLVGLLLLKHIPAGPVFGYVIFWLVVGSVSFWKRTT